MDGELLFLLFVGLPILLLFAIADAKKDDQ